METSSKATVPHPGDDDLVLFFYGEAGAEQSAAIASHVEHCEACRHDLDALKRTLAAVDRHRIPDRGPGYGAEVWARLQPQLDRGAEPAGWLAWFSMRRLAFGGGVALLVVAAFVAGRFSSQPAPVQQAAKGARPPLQQASAAPQVVRDRVLLVAVSDHLERSQMVLVELMNSSERGAVDISGTQQWARDLVPSNRLIRQAADETGEQAVAGVLDDLERVLVEIANSPSHLSSAEFQHVRQRIEAQGIVFKIRVLDSDVRQREAAAPDARTRS